MVVISTGLFYIRSKQLNAWRSLVLDYCQFHGITAFHTQDLTSSPLFNNKDIKRKLAPEDVQTVLEDLRYLLYHELLFDQFYLS